MKNSKQFLAMLLTNWAWCSRQPKVCKAAFLAHSKFEDALTADLIHALICSAGDWRAAAEWVLRRGADVSRVKKFEVWAAKLTEPKKRGLLLEWKGGAL